MITVNKQGNRWVARFPFSYETKDVVKGAGFKFDPAGKLWYTLDETVARRLDPLTAEQAMKEANAAIALSRATNATAAVPAPEGLAYLPYQLVGISYSLEHPNVLIADEMGLGKTIEAIGVINSDDNVKSVLVIVKASLKINWARELVKWMVKPRSVAIASGTKFPTSDVVVINYDILLKHRDAIMARHWDVMIVDECHYVKSPKAQRTKALFGGKLNGTVLKPIPAKRRIFLTGTPIVNRPSELWTLVTALDPHDLGGNFFRFMKRYTNGYHNGWGWDFSGASHLDELQQRMRSKFMVRRLKKDVLKELPPIRRQIITVASDSREATAAINAEMTVFEKIQAGIDAALAERASAGTKEAYEAAVRKLRNAKQFAFTEMSRVRHATAVAKIPHVIEHIQDMLEAEDKIVVFVHHHDVAHALKAAFPTAAVVTGETTVGQRQLEVDKFQDDPDCHVFIGSIQAAGVGFTLTAASHALFAELDWVPGNVSQSEARLHRIGQANSVLVQHLVFDNSVDSRLAHVLIEKQAVIDAAMDDPVERMQIPEAQQSLI